MRHQFSLFPMAFLFHFDIFLFFKLFYSDSRHYSCNQSQILSRFKASQNTSIYGQKCQISSANPPFSLVHSVHQSDVIFETSSISDLEMIWWGQMMQSRMQRDHGVMRIYNPFICYIFKFDLYFLIYFKKLFNKFFKNETRCFGRRRPWSPNWKWLRPSPNGHWWHPGI